MLGIASHVFNVALGGGNWSALCPSHFDSCQRARGSCWICGWMDRRNLWPLPFSTEEYRTCCFSTVGLPVSAHAASYCWSYQLLLTLPVSAHATSFCSRYQLLLTLPFTAHAASYCSRYQLLLTLPVTAHAASYCWRYQLLLTLPVTADAASNCSSCQLLLTLPVTVHATSYCSRYQLLLTIACQISRACKILRLVRYCVGVSGLM